MDVAERTRCSEHARHCAGVLPLALHGPYTYEVPQGEELSPGDFVVAPLRPMKRIGVVWREAEGGRKPVDPKKLKAVIEKLDVPPLPANDVAFADGSRITPSR